jgi:hypothetical protein
MTDLHAGAEPLFDEMDTVYPPMKWTAKWSTGDNLPFGHAAMGWLRVALAGYCEIKDWYQPGLLLFSEQGDMEPVPNGQKRNAGITVFGYTRRHALALFREAALKANTGMRGEGGG